MMDSTYNYVLLIESYKKKLWSFPKGKKNENEEDLECAVREADEECSIAISPYLDPDQQPVSNVTTLTPTTLFFASKVPMNYRFEAKFQQEVGQHQWWLIDDLVRECNSLLRWKFIIVYPFLDDIKKYSEEKKKVLNMVKRSPEMMFAIVDRFVSKDDEMSKKWKEISETRFADLKKDREYIRALYKALLLSVSRIGTDENFLENEVLIKALAEEHRGKEYITNFSPWYDEERSDMFESVFKTRFDQTHLDI